MDLVVQTLDLVEKDYFGLSVKKSSQPVKKEKGKSEEASLEEFPPIVSFQLHTTWGKGTFVKNLHSETSLIQHLYNPTFSLIRPLYEVQSPYISMVRGTP